MSWIYLVGAAVGVLVVVDILLFARRRRQRSESSNERRLKSLARAYAWDRVMRRSSNKLLTDQRDPDAR